MSALLSTPHEFCLALEGLRAAQCRPEVRLEEIPAPSRLAPYATAFAADLRALRVGPVNVSCAHSDPQLATGRFVLLYDPEASPLWEGNFRVVTYIRAALEPDLGNDPMFSSVAWTWLVEALEDHQAQYRAAAGTATRILSESHGSLAHRPTAMDVELRASWTPTHCSVKSHLEAWSDMICSFAGCPRLPEGVSPLSRWQRV